MPNDLRQIIERPPQRRVSLQDSREKASLASTHVDDSLELREVVCIDNRGVFRSGKIPQASSEPGTGLGVFGQILEEAHAVHAIEARFTAQYAIAQNSYRVPPRPVAGHVADHSHPIVQ